MTYSHSLSSSDKRRLDQLFDRLLEASKTYSGYPASLNFDYSELNRFLSMSINNIGDPHDSSNYRVNTHDFEKEVIDFFANLLHLHESCAGYVTNGGTESNLYGLYLGSYHFPNGIIYYSKDSHYSIEKIIRIIKARSICINSTKNGEMDVDDLYYHLKQNKELPAIFLLNIGTTMKGAIDNIDKIKSQLDVLGITQHYIHCDAALHGCFLPFVKDPPPFDFRAGIDSIAISGHKFIGSPIPCGIAISKKKYLKNLQARVSYVRIKDSTVSGSRNGITPLYMWYAIKRHQHDGFVQMTNHCLELSQNLCKKIHDLGIAAYRNHYSNVVVFERPSEEFIGKWQVATCDGIAHFIVMPHHSNDFFDKVLDDLAKDSPKP